MKKKNSKKWTLVLVLLLVVSVGYAALASNLKINGSSSVKSATWDVYWNNVQVTQGSVEATQGNGARITDQKKTQVEYSVTLNEPGDFYEFTVDAVNNGTIDAMIASEGIVNGAYSDANYQNKITLPKTVSYTVTYADGTAIAPKHLLAKKSGNTPTTETYKVRIEYKNDDSINPGDLNNTNDLTYYFKFSVNYVQADTTAEPSHQASVISITRQNPGQITPGDLVEIGDTEDFYVISSNTEKTVLLAKYNLLVGLGEYDDTLGEYTLLDSLNTPGYGLQSITATAYVGPDAPGEVNFSDSVYWMNGNSLKNKYNPNNEIYLKDGYCVDWMCYDSIFKYISDDSDAFPYIYDENSDIYQYISGETGYVSKLIEMGAPSTITGRLLSYEEAIDAIDVKDNGVSIIYNGIQTFWLGTATNEEDVFAVYNQENSDIRYIYSYYPNNMCTGGVRPVIEIPTSALQ